MWQNSVLVVVECPPTAYSFKYAATTFLSTPSHIQDLGAWTIYVLKQQGLKRQHEILTGFVSCSEGNLFFAERARERDFIFSLDFSLVQVENMYWLSF